jgi:HD-like signal output (HDOD) protein/CheY-like chemotaxis protein
MMRILFVDDDPFALALLQRTLSASDLGWDIRYAGCGSDALGILAAEEVDVLVADLEMPTMNGEDLLLKARQLSPGTARLILSGHRPHAERGELATLTHQFLSKPCDTFDVVRAVNQAVRKRNAMSGEAVLDELTRAGRLPGPPAALTALLSVLDDPQATMRQVAAAISADLGLATKVLQLANSSIFAAPCRVTSLEAAVTRIGLRTLKALALNQGLLSSVEHVPGLDPRWLPELSKQALQIAELARNLAAPNGKDDAFCAGLLMESGQLALAGCFQESFQTIWSVAEMEELGRAELELAAYGVTHAQVGAYLLSLWGLPAVVVEVAAAHTQPLAIFREPPMSAFDAALLAHWLVESESEPLCRCEADPRGPEVLDWVEDLAAVRSWRAARSAPDVDLI